jgi:Sulfatase-modifying factor enzyme 1
MNFFKLLLFAVSFLIQGKGHAQQFYSVPANTILPYDILGIKEEGSLKDNTRIKTKIKVEAFDISHQITFGAYKTYLEAIKKDSSIEFYKTQLPDSSIFSKENYQTYITDKKYDSFAVASISWDAAMQYCKWKTIHDTGVYLYRLPKLSEWLAAYKYLGDKKLPNDINKYFSDWTLSFYYEGISSRVDDSFAFDASFFAKQNDPPRLKRKMAMGDSYLIQHENLVEHIRGLFAFSGYREVSFRIVKEKISNISTFRLNKSILDFWGMDYSKIINSKTIL